VTLICMRSATARRDGWDAGLSTLIGLARISHSGIDFRVAERERTGEHVNKVAVVG
jgi:hypothetical protein